MQNRFRPSATLDERASGVRWIFSPYPSNMAVFCYWLAAAALGPLVHWVAGASWGLAIFLVGLVAALLFWGFRPLWEDLTMKLRYHLALSRISLFRRLARGNAALVAHLCWPNGNISYQCVLTMEEWLATPPAQVQKRIREVTESLRSSVIWQLAHNSQEPAAVETRHATVRA